MKSLKASRVLYWSGVMFIIILNHFNELISAILIGILFFTLSMVAAYREHKKAKAPDADRFKKYIWLYAITILLFIAFGVISLF